MTAASPVAPDDEEATLAAVEALVRRARSEAVSFDTTGLGGAVADDGLTDIRELLDGADAPESDPRGARWREAHAKLAAFCRQVEEDLRFAAVVRTQTDEAPAAATWMGWGGTTATVAGPGTDARAHFAAVRSAVVPRLRRIRLLTLTLAATARIAAAVSIPGGALAALPVAFHLVRRVRSTLREPPLP